MKSRSGPLDIKKVDKIQLAHAENTWYFLRKRCGEYVLVEC